VKKALVVLAVLNGCGPRLQVALWQDRNGQYVATMHCQAGGKTEAAEVRSASLLKAHTPTEAQ